MNDTEKKGPGRPKKYATDAERKKAYRERKKEERLSWEKSRVKRIVELQERVDRMEKTIAKTTHEEREPHPDQELYFELREHIKARSTKYTAFELVEMSLEDLQRIQDALVSRYYGSSYNPILAALETAIMPSVDKEFESRKTTYSLKDAEKEYTKRIAREKDKVTPKTDKKVDEYIKKLEKEGFELSHEDLISIRSTMEKRSDEISRPWKAIKAPYRTDQIIDVFHELMMLFNVQAEISRRERDDRLDLSIERLENRLEGLEKTLNSETERAVRESAARRESNIDG